MKCAALVYNGKRTCKRKALIGGYCLSHWNKINPPESTFPKKCRHCIERNACRYLETNRTFECHRITSGRITKADEKKRIRKREK